MHLRGAHRLLGAEVCLERCVQKDGGDVVGAAARVRELHQFARERRRHRPREELHELARVGRVLVQAV
jgi:hypothetical protein